MVPYAMTNNGWTLSTYSIDSTTGAIAFVDRKDIPSTMGDIAVDPFGRFLYTTMVNSTVPAVNAFAIDAATGVPTFKGGCRAGTNNSYRPVIAGLELVRTGMRRDRRLHG